MENCLIDARKYRKQMSEVISKEQEQYNSSIEKQMWECENDMLQNLHGYSTL